VQQYIARRLLLNIPVLFLVVTLVFLASHARPDWAEQRAAQGFTTGMSYDEAVRQIRKVMGTDKPLHEQYGEYLLDVVRLDFGTSLLTRNSVMSELKNRWGTSIELGILEILVASIIGIPIGVISAIRQDTWLDYVLRFLAILGLAIPNFYLATLLLLVAFNWFGWYPPITTYAGFFTDPLENLRSMAIPALAGGFTVAAVVMRLLRSQLLEVLRQDYVRTAWAKGLRERTVVTRHALKNAMIPVVTVLGFMLAAMFGGNVVLESMFRLPGIGQFAVIEMQQNDFPVVQGIILLVAMILVLVNLVVDLSYAWLDPRIRYG
jgi:peptide/nickel transport system permease protein